ncbi:hypothetical protein FJ417_03365 [Mesorhizobium sp. B3-1-7]|uniref:hypothetical protein n=1 Tax=Mesorhizobium sp. B3-1-7 TaxID=2589894 RepID=UPI001129B678|nr:hypothetical protein [Mesorhizobium sp. B3-1-7]TPI63955.1 hypothetical protein FJ417_03365 [Mesorhizobium sp. B3-1-7]
MSVLVGVLIILLGLGEMVMGIDVMAQAQSSIHEILAVAAFGFGSVTLALGVISLQLRRQW